MRKCLAYTTWVLAVSIVGTACGGEAPGEKHAAPAAPPTWVTLENPPAGAGPNDKARHIDFSLRHPSTWQMVETFREGDDRGFIRIERRGAAQPYDLVFQVRSFRRGDPKRAVATFIDDLAATMTKVDEGAAARGATKRLIRKGPTTLAGKPAHEIVVLETDPGVPGKLLRIWRRIVLLEIAPTEWGALMTHAWIAARTDREDPESSAVQAELQGVFDSLALKP